MTTITPTPPFPCPFCRSARVDLVGGGLVFLHYKCGACAEVWTAMAAPRPALLRPTAARASKFGTASGRRTSDANGAPDTDSRIPGLSRKEKFWRH